MKKLTFLTAAMLLICFSASAQHQMNQQVVKKLMNQNRPNTAKDIIAPEKAEYYTNDGNNVHYRDKFIYDPYDYNMTQKMTDVMDGSWGPYSQESFEYDFENNMTQALLQLWNNDDWVNSEKIDFTYEDYGFFYLLKEETLTKWNGSTWVNDTKYIYDYDPVVTVIVKDWASNTWENHYLYTYDAEGNQTTVTLQYWLGGAWQNQEMQIYVFNNETQVDTITFKNWTNNGWVNEELDTYYYSEQGKIEKIIKAQWDNGAWSPSKYMTVTYELNKDGNCERALCESNFGGPDNTDIEMFYNDDESMTFMDVHEVTMDYVDITAVGEATAKNQFELHPNPVKDRLVIRGEGFEKAEVYSLSGQKVMESGTTELDVNTLATGAYLVKIQRNNGTVETQKFMVR